MKPSFESSKIPETLREAILLDLPECESLPPRMTRISLDRVCELSRELRRSFPHAVPTERERWEAKGHVEFVL